MTNPPLALPDFEVISRSYTDLSRELGRCANLPTLQGGNVILGELRALRGQMGQFQEQLGGVQEQLGGVQEQLGGVQEQLGHMTTLITARQGTK